MIGKIIRFLKPYVVFNAEGPDIEGFITECVKKGIYFISPQKKEYNFSAALSAKDYKKIRKPARKYSVKANIVKKQGLYFVLKKNKNKAFFAAGSLFICFFVLFMNLFIWEINVTGNKNISKEDILFAAEKAGLTTGTPAKKHFVQNIEWFILNEHKELASVEINIQGSVANILIDEIKDKPKMVSDDDIPVNIIASRYGVIRKINVFDGWENVKIGDPVMKGDLLVSAVYEDRYKKLTLKHARAEIIAETDYFIQIEFPLKQTIKEINGIRKKTYEINILGKNFLLGNNNNDLPKEKTNYDLYFFWIKLPINVIETAYFNVKEKNITYNFEQSRQGAFFILEEKEKTEMKDMEIISKKTEEIIKNDKYIIKAYYTVLMDIAEEQAIESNIPWKNTDDMS